MADFTMSAPGTVNNPFTPANVIFPTGALRSDATGIRGQNSPPGTMCAFAHNVAYGAMITSTWTVAAGATSNGDWLIVGSLVRSGANAGAIIGCYFGAFAAGIVTCDPLNNLSHISSDISITRSVADVFSCSVSISGGTATIVASQNGGGLSFSANTTTTYASEASLAAGGQYNPGNNGSLYFSQFTGTGVSAAVASVVPFTPPPIWTFS